MMVYSSDDMLAFVAELNMRRIGMVMSRRQKRLTKGLILPAAAMANHSLTERQLFMLATARKLHARYMRGTYQHDEDEISAIRDLAYWLIEEHAQNEGMPVTTRFIFDVRSKQVAMPPPAGRYKTYVQKVHAM